jgi:hypothetical protein
MFKKADTNNDGSIDKSELTSMLKNAPKSQNASGREAPNVDKIFKSLDSDGDNKITASEMDAGMAKMMNAAKAMRGGPRPSGGPPPGGAPPGGAPPSGSTGESKGASETATSTKTYDPKDANKDGTVTYAEETAYDATHPTVATQAESQTATVESK